MLAESNTDRVRAWAALGVLTLGWMALARAEPSAAPVPAVPVVIFSAGSLREVVGELTQAVAPLGIEVRASFGGSGLMRERIEKGEPADVLLSADLGSPRKLEAEHRTALPVVAFARNRMCILSRRAMGVTADNLIEQLLKPGVRLKTSQPVADPSGDYAWAILDAIDSRRPGAGAVLKQKAQASMALTAPPGQSPVTALLTAGQVDMSITYCSGVRALDSPELARLDVPAELDPHPVYGAAVLSTRSQALQLVLYLLSERGQAIIARAGLVPLVSPPRAAP
jgi:ABC-type molybdate transport system substrate-binding protein